jgi:hypothetical protein
MYGNEFNVTLQFSAHDITVHVRCLGQGVICMWYI